MEKSKPVKCTTCNITESSSCEKWCAGCTLYKLLRIVILIAAICVAYSFGEQVGMIKSMLMQREVFVQPMPYQQKESAVESTTATKELENKPTTQETPNSKN